MSEKVPAEISVQLSQALNVIGRHLESTLLAVHLYGSALDGGLKPYSDIDLLVTVAAPLNDAVRQALLVDLLEVSASPGQNKALRALEVTIVVHSDIVPWPLSGQAGTAVRRVAAQRHPCGHLRARHNRF
uniref:Truncated aminoglycoside adenyltransferase n=1 Tax=Salmonella typhimurium TaxID=90371 RepID=A0A0U3KRB2_SALTM|nr:truncated aminoglycoside adenyltransferase [Salmonella enterica subsp. enterica serovar Typhimurium]